MGSTSKKLKIFLFSIIGLCAGIILTVFITYRFLSHHPEIVIEAIQQKASMAIQGLQQTATRDGVREWRLEAESAQLHKDTNKAVLSNLTVTFFLADGKQARLKADKGILDTRTQDFETSGHVVLFYQPYELKTESLQYHHDQRIMTSKKPVTATGMKFKIKADAMTFDLKTHQALLEGNVESIFEETL